MLKRKKPVLAVLPVAALMSIVLTATAADKPEMKDLSEFSCKDVMILSGVDRDISIAFVHGYVLGDGLEIALCGDLIVAAENAQFGLPETGLGIIPAAGGSQTLPRTVGRAMALDMLLSGRRLGADEACEVGLVNRVVPIAELLPTARTMARRITSRPPAAVRGIKRAVTRGLNVTLAQGLVLERNLAAAVLFGQHRVDTVTR